MILILIFFFELERIEMNVFKLSEQFTNIDFYLVNLLIKTLMGSIM